MLWFRTLARWVHPAIAAFWIALVGTGSLSVEHLYDAEVWGPHMLFAALVVSLTTREQPPRPLWLGLVLGAATAHHLTAVLLVPLAVVGAWPAGGRPLVAGLLRNGLEGVLGSLLGLSVFVTLRISAGDPGDPGWTWGNFDTWAGWLHHITRGDYGTTELSLHESQASALDQILRAHASVAGNLSGGLAGTSPLSSTLLLGAIAFVATLRMRDALPLRYSFAYGATLILTLVFFPSLADLDPTRPHSVWILERFDFLPLALIMGTAAFATEGMRRVDPQRSSLPSPLATAGAAIVASTLLLWSMSQSLAHPPAHDRGVEAYARALYASVDPEEGRAVVFGTDDHRSFPAVYQAEVHEGDARVLYIDPSLMNYDWYRERIWARWPELPRERLPIKLIMAIEGDPVLKDTPIFLANFFSVPSHSVPVVPQGVLMRVWPGSKGDPVKHGAEVLASHLAALERIAAREVSSIDFAEAKAGRAVWSGDLLWSFVDRQREMLSLLAAAGDEDGSTRLQTRLRELDTPGAELAVEKAP
jgi:hypothetical protein